MTDLGDDVRGAVKRRVVRISAVAGIDVGKAVSVCNWSGIGDRSGIGSAVEKTSLVSRSIIFHFGIYGFD